MENTYKKRESWFIARIGKRVYRNKTTCKCGICKTVGENGLIITDEMHADYLHMIESDFTAEGHPTRYFDTLDEAKKFETKKPG